MFYSYFTLSAMGKYLVESLHEELIKIIKLSTIQIIHTTVQTNIFHMNT